MHVSRPSQGRSCDYQRLVGPALLSEAHVGDMCYQFMCVVVGTGAKKCDARRCEQAHCRVGKRRGRAWETADVLVSCRCLISRCSN